MEKTYSCNMVGSLVVRENGKVIFIGERDKDMLFKSNCSFLSLKEYKLESTEIYESITKKHNLKKIEKAKSDFYDNLQNENVFVIA